MLVWGKQRKTHWHSPIECAIPSCAVRPGGPHRTTNHSFLGGFAERPNLPPAPPSIYMWSVWCRLIPCSRWLLWATESCVSSHRSRQLFGFCFTFLFGNAVPGREGHFWCLTSDDRGKGKVQPHQSTTPKLVLVALYHFDVCVCVYVGVSDLFFPDALISYSLKKRDLHAQTSIT